MTIEYFYHFNQLIPLKNLKTLIIFCYNICSSSFPLIMCFWVLKYGCNDMKKDNKKMLATSLDIFLFPPSLFSSFFPWNEKLIDVFLCWAGLISKPTTCKIWQITLKNTQKKSSEILQTLLQGFIYPCSMLLNRIKKRGVIIIYTYVVMFLTKTNPRKSFNRTKIFIFRISFLE